MAELRNVDIFSVSYKVGKIMGLLGLVAGILYSVGGLVVDTLVTLDLIQSTDTPGLSLGTALAFGALLGMPLIFGVVGLSLGLVVALIYNLLIRLLGGSSSR